MKRCICMWVLWYFQHLKMFTSLLCITEKKKKTKKLKEMRVLSLFSHEFTFHNHNTKRIMEKCNQKKEGEAKLLFWIICYFGVFTFSSLSMYLLSDKCVFSFNSLANIMLLYKFYPFLWILKIWMRKIDISLIDF